MISIGTKIKARRKALNLSVDYVAEAIGVSRATLYRYESPDMYRIPATCLAPLSEVLKVSQDFFLGDDPEDDTWLEEHATPMKQIINLPIIGIVRAGVGGIIYEESLGEEFVESSVLKGYSQNEFFWLKVKGDSMEPRLFEDDLVLVRKQTSIESGSYAVVLVDDEEGVVKRVTYDENTITLHSQNHNYPPRVFKDREVLRVRVVGQVVKSQSSF